MDAVAVEVARRKRMVAGIILLTLPKQKKAKRRIGAEVGYSEEKRDKEFYPCCTKNYGKLKHTFLFLPC